MRSLHSAFRDWAKQLSRNMEQDINRLHNRHIAKIITKLQEINTAEIVIDAVKRQFSFYTNDIKDQVLTSKKFNQNDKEKNQHNRRLY